MALLTAKDDIYVDNPLSSRGGKILVARKGHPVPKRLEHLLDDGDKRTKSADAGKATKAENPTGRYDDPEWTQPKLLALVKDRGLEPESQRKADLIDALEAHDEAQGSGGGGTPVVSTGSTTPAD